MSDPVVCVFGDSIANGLGAQGRGYAHLVAEALGGELADATGTALQVFESYEHHLEEATGVPVVLIAHGVTEGIVRPDPLVLRWMPGRYRKAWWLDPRPYFSSGTVKGRLQRTESWLRVRLKLLMMRFGRPSAWRSPEEFRQGLTLLVDAVSASSRTVLLLTPTDVDERWFPASEESLEEMAAVVREVARERQVGLVDLRGRLHRWDDYLADHFHPNGRGHELIAHGVLEVLEDMRRTRH